MKQTALIVFIKNLLLGRVKTRLAETMGDKRALDIYRQLCTFTVVEAMRTGLPVYFYFSDFSDPEFIKSHRIESGSDLHQFRVQGKSDLGIRMHQAFKEVLKDYKRAFIFGTDCPYLNTRGILDAVCRLESNDADVVIGPAEDGGYYGLGMNQPVDIFSGVAWSTGMVLDQTINSIEKKSLKYELLATLADIDYESDWVQFLESPSALYFKEVIRASSPASDTAGV